jgi:hypothetical protein
MTDGYYRSGNRGGEKRGEIIQIRDRYCPSQRDINTLLSIGPRPLGVQFLDKANNTEYGVLHTETWEG